MYSLGFGWSLGEPSLRKLPKQVYVWLSSEGRNRVEFFRDEIAMGNIAGVDIFLRFGAEAFTNSFDFLLFGAFEAFRVAADGPGGIITVFLEAWIGMARRHWSSMSLEYFFGRGEEFAHEVDTSCQ